MQLRVPSEWRSGLQMLIFQPNRSINIFPVATVLVIVSVLVGVHWSATARDALVAVALAACLAVGFRVTMGSRLPAWFLHVDVGAATLFVSVLAALGPDGHVNLAVLYVWITLYAALYFRPARATAHIALAGAAYAVVLYHSAHSDVDGPVFAWLSTFGTAVVASAVVLALVDVLRRSSLEDPLTGLANRRAWDERLEAELERARRSGAPVSLALMDLDHFKEVNDRHGHQAGDRLLRRCAFGWSHAIRANDFIARLGGDEFAVLCMDTSDWEIQQVAKRLHESLPEGVACSVGVVTWDGEEAAANLVRRADEAMYRVKRNRRAA